MKRILIVNVNWVGDVLFSTPIFPAIKKAYPDSYVACMIVPLAKEVLAGNPAIDDLIIFDEEGKEKSLIGKIKFISRLKKERFDIVFLLHRSFTRALIVYLAGIAQRIGYYTKKRAFLLTQAIDAPLVDSNLHRMDYYLNIVESAGIKIEDRNYQFFVSDEDRNFAANLLTENGVGRPDFLAVLNPGGNWDLKHWPKEKFAFLTDKLISEFNARVAIVGAAKDISLALEIANLMQNKPIILAGKTNLKQLGALLERANVMVSADSGPMHIACAVGTPTIILFGPTSQEITGPKGKGKCIIIQKDTGCKIPCYKLDCPDNRCMKIISVEEVVEEIRKLKK
ncbi:MAG: lipopolysaccharide heptosyltransferase II [Candidatus Omnitrophota bacterium]|nr:lipopolysaccharide heptosyltransferase II [Candidatus Omnitrophota bacterium]